MQLTLPMQLARLTLLTLLTQWTLRTWMVLTNSGHHDQPENTGSLPGPCTTRLPCTSTKRLHEALDYATLQEVETEYYLTQPINTGL